MRLLIGPGDAVVTSAGAYPTFNYHVAGFGGRLHTVPLCRAITRTPRRCLPRRRETNAKLIYLANPDNPMGSWHGRGIVETMVGQVPDGCLLVLDEAYGQFLAPANVPGIDADDPRVIRFRTFSKAYGMAGARVGYGIGAPDLITAFNKVRNHFGMTRISQAGALAALGDQDYLAQVHGQGGASPQRASPRSPRDNGLSAAALGHQFRHHRLRPGRRFRPRRSAPPDRAGRLRADAVRRAAGPLHPCFRRQIRRSGHSGHGPAPGACRGPRGKVTARCRVGTGQVFTEC